MTAVARGAVDQGTVDQRPTRRTPPTEPTPPTRHGPIAQLLIAWSPLSAILVAYVVAQWISAPLGTGDGAATNRVGAPLHVLAPARGDEALFGTVPTVWLQERLGTGTPHWYDAVGAVVYLTHFVAIPVLTALAWFRWRERFRGWIVAVLITTFLGTATYVAFPAAPPWLAAQRGAIGDVDRTSSLGWEWLHLDAVARLTEGGQGSSNPVAAMPSLHAGAALLVALFAWPSVSRWARTALLAYALAMAVVLVQTGEHYVVDVLAGWAVAVAGVVAGAVATSRLASRSRSPVPAHAVPHPRPPTERGAP